MLLECPSCASRYIIDPRKLGVEGRQVRCASCPNEWFARLEDLIDPPAAQAAVAAPAYASPDDPYAGLTIAPDPSQLPPPPPPKLDLYAGWGDGAKQSGEGEAPPPPPRAARAGDSDGDKAEPKADAPGDIDAIFANNTDAPDTSGHNWDAKTEPEPEPEPPPPPPVRRKLPPPKKKPVFRDRAIAAAQSPAVIGAIGFALILAVIWQRESVVRVAPSSAGLFAALGMPVNLMQLEFGEVRTSLVREPDGRFLVVEAVIRNPTSMLLLVPRIETTLRGADQRSVYVWTSDPPRSTLRPGEALHFRTRLATPPEEGRDVAVRFAVGGRSAEAKR